MSIKIENTQVFGLEGAIRGARNPMNSWDKSDSIFYTYMGMSRDLFGNFYGPEEYEPDLPDWGVPFYKCGLSENNMIMMEVPCLIGPNDHKLLMNLCKGGTEEAKWRRMVHVQMDITAPLYWWKEFETYKVGTVSNSCSTMHKIHAKEFTLEDFSCEHLFTAPDVDTIPVFISDSEHDPLFDEIDWHYDHGAYYSGIEIVNRDYSTFDEVEAHYATDLLQEIIYALNNYRSKFLETKDKKYWWQMIQLLPSSYNQRRTIDLNYEVLASQYRQRKNHKLDEWREYCELIKTLPYSEFITLEENA